MTARQPPQCGLFVPDPDVPPDHNGRQACANCHLVGAPGDAHHQLPDAGEAQAEERRRAGEDISEEPDGES